MLDDDHPGAQAVAERMAQAAGSWLDLLDPAQRPAATGATPGDDDTERLRWFYTPTDHGGLTLHEQRPAQQRAAMRLLSTGLSEAGYATAATVIGLENVLDRAEGFTATFGRERGRDPGMYYLRVFGTPGATRPWAWRFGGHHVSVNVLVVDGRVRAVTPLFLGASPASTPLPGGALLRPLGAVEDLARDLVRSLPRDLADVVLLAPRSPGDILSTNRSRVFPADAPTALWRTAPNGRPGTSGPLDAGPAALSPTPTGLPASALDAAGREQLRALLACYLDRVPAEISPLHAYADDAALDAVHLVWAGGTAPGEQHYHRVQGPGLLLEWDNTQRGGNHAHSVWRDPDADFGVDVLAAHREAESNHTRSAGEPGRPQGRRSGYDEAR